jgi:hypothetical protein
MIEVESWPFASAPTASALASVIVPCSRVAHDLLTEPHVTARLINLEWWCGYDPEHLPPASWMTIGLKAESQARFGSGVDLSMQTFALTARLAEVVQDDLTGYEFIEWPTCPRHRSLMLPDVYESEAWWSCKGPNSHRVRIGTLNANS